jgi:integrase
MCWVYRPGEHKTAHHGHARLILVGPKAQQLLAGYFKDDPAAYLFCPADATQERNEKVKASRQTPGRPWKRKVKPKRVPGAYYSTRAYWRAIARACRKAGIHVWSPNKLRHARATELRPFGLDVVKTILGHSKVETTQIYSEKDLAAAMDLMAKVG